MNVLTGASIVVTGGSGSFGRAFLERMLSIPNGPARVCILSRDEHKQANMRAELHDDHRLRWFLGDVRDRERLEFAFAGADIVIHAAAMKSVPACEENVFEAFATNYSGSANVVKAAISQGVKRVVALSTDKAVAPVTSYGASKQAMERAIIQGNVMAGGKTKLACTRYGNITDSNGSVLPIWRKQISRGEPITITDPSSTRFMMEQSEAVDLVILATNQMRGGEIFIPKLPAYRLDILANALNGTDYSRKAIGLRVGEKLHESLISPDETALDFGDHYRVGGTGGKPVLADFTYRSDSVRMLTLDELRAILK